jgi:VCBS repeat protein
MKKHLLCVVLLLVFSSASSFAVEGVENGFNLWTVEFDSYDPSYSYFITKWTYDIENNFWDAEEQLLDFPFYQEEEYEGRVYDMGMSMLEINGEVSAVIAVSKGDGHFPSLGTQFQHRKLDENGFWAVVQDPILTTPADVSPLGLDLYAIGDEVHMVWIEDNDAAGPVSNMCEVYDGVLTVNADGTLTLEDNPTLVYSKELNWGGTYPGFGGVAGVTACDYDGDGDIDYAIAQIFYGNDPTTSSINIIEQTGSGEFSTSLNAVHSTPTGGGSEALTCGDIDGDDNLDFFKTNEEEGNWSQIYWYEKEGDVLELRGMVVDCKVDGLAWGINVGHLFGIYVNEPAAVVPSGLNWEIH